MEAENVFKSEVFRPIVITLVPGVIATLPYYFVILYFFPNILSTLKSNDATFFAIIVLFAASIAAGYVIENIGSRIEYWLWSKHSSAIHEADWNFYLLSSRLRDLPLDAYMKEVVVRMKFENSFMVTLVTVWIGLSWLYRLDVIAQAKTYWLSTALIAVGVTYLLFESLASGKLLNELRGRLRGA